MNNMTASRVEFPKTFIIEVLWFHVTRAVENYEVLTFDSNLRALGVPKNQKAMVFFIWAGPEINADTSLGFIH